MDSLFEAALPLALDGAVRQGFDPVDALEDFSRAWATMPTADRMDIHAGLAGLKAKSPPVRTGSSSARGARTGQRKRRRGRR